VAAEALTSRCTTGIRPQFNSLFPRGIYRSVTVFDSGLDLRWRPPDPGGIVLSRLRRRYANPAANFFAHFIVGFNGRLYDPSYGKDFANIGLWEDASVAGFYKLELGNFISKWLIRQDLLNNDLEVTTRVIG